MFLKQQATQQQLQLSFQLVNDYCVAGCFDLDQFIEVASIDRHNNVIILFDSTCRDLKESTIHEPDLGTLAQSPPSKLGESGSHASAAHTV